MTDVEVSGQRPATVPNPYANGDTSGVLPTWHPINVLWRVIWIGISLFGLQRFDAYHKVMHDPNVRHEWFKIGLATTVGIIMLKAYVEMYAGKLNKQKISYKTFPQTTHAVMVLIVLSSVSFNVALWPAFGSGAMVVMTLVGAIILNFCLLMPTYVQNLVAFGLLAFFLQEYS